MKVKIKGKITAERIVNALQIAIQQIQNTEPDCQIYGADLDLSVFNKEGVPISICDERGWEVGIIIKEGENELEQPLLTSKGRQLINQRDNEIAQKNAIEKERYMEMRKKQDEIKEKELAKYIAANDITSKLLIKMPGVFVSKLNKTIVTVWNEFNPIFQKGKFKGQPIGMPQFTLVGTQLCLCVEGARTPQFVKNPIYKRKNRLDITVPHWTNYAWLEATARMTVLLDELSKEL